MKITILKVTTRPLKNRRDGRPAVYFFLDGENVLQNLSDRRSRPYDDFKKVLDQALEMAGLTNIKASDLGWSQYAGCTCPCSPGFIAKHAPLNVNVFVTYKMEEGEMPKTVNQPSARRIERALYLSYPEPKDNDRARNIKTFGEASKMANLITDPEKLARRIKAVIANSPYEMRKPFIARMREMGFTETQINTVLGVKKNVAVMMPAA